jgi:hypothetical protein
MLNQLISRTRRNHALEHATIHVLSEKFKNYSAQGNSTHEGFYLNIYGDVPAEAVREAVDEAHSRMIGGEHQLGVHPNCGTVLLTTATMAAMAAQTTFGLEQWRQKRPALDLNVIANALPSAVLAVALALLVSRPLGMAIQARYTTDGNLGNLRVISVRQIKPSFVTRFFKLLLSPGRDLEAKSYKVETAG